MDKILKKYNGKDAVVHCKTKVQWVHMLDKLGIDRKSMVSGRTQENWWDVYENNSCIRIGKTLNLGSYSFYHNEGTIIVEYDRLFSGIKFV